VPAAGAQLGGERRAGGHGIAAATEDGGADRPASRDGTRRVARGSLAGRRAG
jgi:hypothetical protein